jgi:hypothetical protein
MLTAGFLALAGMAQAGQSVVVELFTSQGCSSCPPADRILGELANEPDVIALAFHVDYWDYLGWKDEFASPANTSRQKAYARAAGERSIYTPQMVVGGRDHVIGSKAMKVSQLVRAHMETEQPAKVRLQRQGDTVLVRASADRAMPRTVVQLVTYTPEATVAIQRGENAGRTFTYHNVVRQVVVLGTWDGKGEFSASANVPPGLQVVVLVQAQGAGPIMGASRLN